jgi:hypothetical protein
MGHMRARTLPAFLLCLATGVSVSSAAAETDAAVTRTSKPVRLLRTWEETVKQANGREFARRVEIVFDYSKGYAYENFYSVDGGAKYQSRRLGAGQPAPSPEEVQEAFATVRADPEFARVYERFNVVHEGGFVLIEGNGKPCGPGSRCLRVFLLSSDRAGTIRQVVVDLVKERVVYDDFTPRSIR